MYDYIIPIGFNCNTVMTLKNLNLRKEAFPFDWAITSPNLIIHALQDRCKDLWNIECLRFVNETEHKGIHARMYVKSPTPTHIIYNFKYGIVFHHDNNAIVGMEEAVHLAKEKYDRRVNRLFQVLESSSRVLFVFCGQINKSNVINNMFTMEEDQVKRFYASEYEMYLNDFVGYIQSEYLSLEFHVLACNVSFEQKLPNTADITYVHLGPNLHNGHMEKVLHLFTPHYIISDIFCSENQ